MSTIDRELALADHVHELDASEHISGSSKRLEAQHRPGDALDRTMVLFDDVIKIFDLAYDDRQRHTAVDIIDGGLIATALSIAILSGVPFSRIAFSKNRLAAAVLRCAVRRKSTVFPSLSTAR